MGGASSIWYRVVGAYTLCSAVKYVLEKCAISFRAYASAMHPSTLALLRTVDLIFFSSLSSLYIHLYCTGPPTDPSHGKCTNKCCITFIKQGGKTCSKLNTRKGI